MKTKASMLFFLRDKLKSARIIDGVFFTVGEWRENVRSCHQELLSKFSNVDRFIVRSSTLLEDQYNQSFAGKFKSVLNVCRKNLKQAIESVIRSYYNDESLTSNEILIQPMLQSVGMNGVLFTKDPNTGSPYYIINYDLGCDTTAITSGAASGQTVFIARSCRKIGNNYFKKLIMLAKELEHILGRSNLDIEFAFDEQINLYLFQVRTLITPIIDRNFSQKTVLQNIISKVDILNIEHPYLYGKRSILGIMPDWNPAEIIGIRPKPLALTIYKELITDSTWAYQRHNYGYKNLRSFPLMIDLCGLPYIDVRVSFNSFIPKELDHKISEKLVNYYLDRLESEPFLHDKIEFDIVFSCYTFDIIERIQVLKQNNFKDNEISSIMDSLRYLTNHIINMDKSILHNDIKKIEELKQRHITIMSNKDFDELTKVYWLIEDCKRYGTLPFAGLSRAGFIAIQILNSMVHTKIFSEEEKQRFLSDLQSVSTEIRKDLKSLTKNEFLIKYGHLRPGTYDILSPRYDEAPELYFDWNNTNESYYDSSAEEFKLTLSQMEKIEVILNKHNLECDVLGLFNFIKSAVESREYSKFIFTKTLSDILLLLKSFANKHQISLEDISYLDIKNLLQLYSTSWNSFEEVKLLIEAGKKRHYFTKLVNLPPLITKLKDIEFFYVPKNKPNFITMKSITAKVIKNLSNLMSINGSIIFIQSADPGFDWIFTRGISGFITAYGGVNSHMAIRASEFGIPAAIGVGEKLYYAWSKARVIHLDCANQRVEVVH